jgi:uncharacterized membrane protein
MDEQGVLARLDGFERRLLRLEALLGVLPRAVPPPPPPPIVQPPVPVEDAGVMFTASPEVHAVPPPLPTSSTDPFETLSAIPVVSYPSAPPRKPINQAELEQTIGLKWAGWIGAVVLVIGAALGVRFGYDQGWFSFVTPTVRLVLLALVGCSLIGAGEWVYRKVNQLSAVGLFGAGVAVLFVISYAGFAYFGIYSRNAAFACMGMSTIIGTLVARRGQMVSIAVLSMIGGNLAPVLLQSVHPELFGFLTYLFILQLTSLALAAWGATPKWWTLRGLSLATTSLWIVAVLNVPPPQMTGIFLVIFAGLYQAELIFSAGRSRLSAASAGATFSILVTGGLTAGLLYLIGDADITSRLICVLGLAGATCLIAIGCSRFASRSPAARSLAIGYAMQSLALVVLAIPIAFSGIWIAAAWGLLALCLAGAGYVLDLPVARFTAAAVWALAVGDLVFWADTDDVRHHRVAFTIDAVAIPIYAVAGWALAIVGHLLAVILKERRRGQTTELLRDTVIVVSVLASLIWVAISIAALPLLGATLAILLLGWILMIASQLDEQPSFSMQAAVLFGLATLKWAIVDTLIRRFSPDWDPGHQLPFLTPNIGVAVAIIGSLSAFHFFPRSTTDKLLINTRKLLGHTVLILLVSLWAGTFEIDRICDRLIPLGFMGLDPSQRKQLLWTIWWMLCSCGYLLAMRWVSRGDRQQQGDTLDRMWRLPAGVAVKFLLWDLLLNRLLNSPGISPVVTGPYAFAGTVVLAGLILLHWFAAEPIQAGLVSRRMRRWVTGLIVATLFGLGSVAIDQAFTNDRLSASSLFADPDRAEQVALSIFWSVFAISLVIAGFIWRTAGFRYVGLGLFAVVLLKVVVIDLSQVSTGYRILSFIGLGVLLLGTSVLYGKVSPRLLPLKEKD